MDAELDHKGRLRHKELASELCAEKTFESSLNCRVKPVNLKEILILNILKTSEASSSTCISALMQRVRLHCKKLFRCCKKTVKSKIEVYNKMRHKSDGIMQTPMGQNS